MSRKGTELPGYNHYPWCTCGWCTGGGGGGGKFQSSTVESARERLRHHGVTGFTSCFVNPNARCPICGQAVYFYANSYGSRVYFDELGPPWPKHGCTDNPRTTGTGKFSGPTRRSKSEISEIINSDREAGTNYAGSRSKSTSDWILHVVVEAVFENGTLWVATESISTSDRIRKNFSVRCSEMILDEGDLVSVGDDIFSFIRRDTLEDIEVTDDQVVSMFKTAEEPAPDPNDIPNDRDDLRDYERHHFHSAALSFDELVKCYRPTLINFEKRNVVGPKLVSHYLNESGHRTASGAPWTPRLAFFLISFTDAPTEKTPRSKRANLKSENFTKYTPAKRSQKTKGKRKKPEIIRNSAQPSAKPRPVESVDLPTLQKELDTLETLMVELQEERKKSWLSDKKKRSITERFHNVKKKRDLLWAKLESLKIK
jgi:hypothetical protein